MNLLDSYDDSEEIVKAEIFTKGQKKLPEIAIVCFKKELIDDIKKRNNFEEFSSILVCGEDVKIYKTTVYGKDVIIYRTLIGGPATASMMEEVHSRGVNKFIFFGSCGTLTKDLEKGAFIIPTQCYRDEGTSYHYIPASDFVNVETAEKLENIFKENNIKYELTKTWTTDAIYKETVKKLENRKKDGCKVVEMECASIMAVAKSRNLEAYQFLYSDDTLAEKKWDLKTLAENRSPILNECLDIAFKIVKEMELG